MDVVKQGDFGKSASGKTTIQFGGITTLGWHARTSTAEVWLLDVRGISGSKGHVPALLVPGLPNVEGTPDSVIMVPEAGFEYGVWSLEDSEIDVIPEGTVGRQAALKRTGRPDDESGDAASITHLVDIGFVCNTNRKAPRIPQVGLLEITSGLVSAVPISELGKKRTYNFKRSDETFVYPKPRAFASQFQWEIGRLW